MPSVSCPALVYWLIAPRRMRPLGVAFGLLLAVFAVALIPGGPATQLIPIASAHATLVRSDPSANAVLQAPPAQVQLWFSEEINPLTSRVVVVDPANRQVDRGDSHRSDDDAAELDVSLPLLPAGAYVVVWRTQSAVDGHISGGSYIFRVARPDGTIPPVPAVLPKGNFPGAAGSATIGSGSLDPPALLQTIATWLALLFMTFWAGGVIWQTWILPPGAAPDPDVAAASRTAAARFHRLAPYALVGVLLADVGMILGQAAALAGTLSGAFSPVLLRAILFGSRFGLYWWLRELVTLVALAQTISVSRADIVLQRSSGAQQALAVTQPSALPSGSIPDWRRELLATLCAVPRLPRRLAVGWQCLTWPGRGQLFLMAALIVAFALSGHAAAVPAQTFVYAIAVDLLHLIAESAWIGGLLYVGLALVPAISHLPERARARVLAVGLPEFSAVAITSAALLALTGSLNTTIRMTSADQFLTTIYGRTLAVKIELFLMIAAISAYHAFSLRPRLAAELRRGTIHKPSSSRSRAEVGSLTTRALVRAERRATVPADTGVDGSGNGMSTEQGAAQSENQDQLSGDEPPPGAQPLSPAARALEERLRDWLRREAFLGGAVLLCVALLGIFAGSLAPAPASTTTSGGLVVQTQQAGPYAVTLKVTPAAFGPNTFTVTIRDAQGKPIDGAAIAITTTMLDMDMGPETLQLQPMGTLGPGSYSGDGDLTMGGHWQIAVKVLPPGQNTPLVAVFKFTAT